MNLNKLKTSMSKPHGRMMALAIMTLFFLPACQAKQPDATNTTKTTINTTNKTKKMGTIHLTKAEFLEKVVNYETSPNEWKYLGDKPCLIDFYADWCGPCKAVAPILEELAKEYDGQVYIYKINTDQEQELAGAFGIRSIPSLLFVPMEGQPRMSMGAMPKDQLKKAIDEVLLVK
jgi:thioredoxin